MNSNRRVEGEKGRGGAHEMAKRECGVQKGTNELDGIKKAKKEPIDVAEVCGRNRQRNGGG